MKIIKLVKLNSWKKLVLKISLFTGTFLWPLFYVLGSDHTIYHIPVQGIPYY